MSTPKRPAGLIPHAAGLDKDFVSHVEKYMRLRTQLLLARARELDGEDEDRLLGEMDDLWWKTTRFERLQIEVEIRSLSYVETT